MENVKIVSESSRQFMYHSPFNNEPKPMIDFEYRIKLADKIADFIRRHTNVCRKHLIYPDGNRYYLDDDNIVKYGFISDIEYGDRIGRMFTETVERISNQGDEDYFIWHLLTEDRKRRLPAQIHEQMRKEFGLFDPSGNEFILCFDSSLEMNVAQFFIHLNAILFDPGYEGPKRDRKARIIICGGRHFKDYERLESTMNEVMNKIAPWRDVVEIVSGHCEGADQLGELYAKNHDLPCKVIPAQWEKFGKSAGPIRNSEMVKYAAEAEMPVVVAFRSPRTTGTNDTVKKATKQGFKVFVVDYDNNEN